MTEPFRNGVQRLDRILVIDPNPPTAKMLANLVRGINPSCEIYGARSLEDALALAREVVPQLIFVESGPAFDGTQVARDLRRSELACRQAPMIMVAQEATAALIIGARDAGVHEFLRRPYTIGDLQKRITAVSGKPREWIEAIQYVGPDRRRFNSADYSGARKRRSDGSPEIEKINQAIKIVRACAPAAATQPMQVMRALTAQARTLIEVSSGVDAFSALGMVAASLEAYLAGPALSKGLNKATVEAIAAKLTAAVPKEPAKPQGQTQAA